MQRRLAKPIKTFAAEAPGEGGNSGDTPPADEFKAITTQADLDKVVGDRVARERAKYADYKDLKAKADKLDGIEAANQTEAEKVNARIVDLETKLQASNLDALRRKVAGDHKITDQDDIDLFLTGTDEETLTRQAKRLADRDADRKKNGNHVPDEGKNPKPGEDEMREFTRGLFGQGD